jgi:hypothetical protein
LYRKDKRGVLDLCKNHALEPDRVVDLRLVEDVKVIEKKGKQCIVVLFAEKLRKSGNKVRVPYDRQVAPRVSLCYCVFGPFSYHSTRNFT